MNNRATDVAIALSFAIALALGIALGYKLSTVPNVETYKLLNVAGLVYDLLGVIVLSEVAVIGPRWRKIAIDWLAPGVLWIHTIVPLGACIGGFAAAIISHNAGSKVSVVAFRFFAYSILPLSVLNDLVVFPRFAALKALEPRWRWFALFLLATGVALQLIAAVMALG